MNSGLVVQRKRLVSFFVKRGESRAEAEDMAQEVFLRMLEDGAEFKDSHVMRYGREAWCPNHVPRKVGPPVADITPETVPIELQSDASHGRIRHLKRRIQRRWGR